MWGTHSKHHRNLDINMVRGTPTVKTGLGMSRERRIRLKLAKRTQESISGQGLATAEQSACFAGDNAHPSPVVGKDHVVNKAEMAEGRQLHTNAVKYKM